MKEDEVVMFSYCGMTFGLSTLLFVLKKLLLRDAARSRLSKSEEYVRPVEVRTVRFVEFHGTVESHLFYMARWR